MVGYQLHPADLARVVGEPRLMRLICAICKRVAREPRTSPTCDHRFCVSCLEDMLQNLQNGTANCPEDGKQLYQFFPDDVAWREVVGLAIHCTFMDDGCKWRGQIGHLEMHVQRYHNDEQQGFANKDESAQMKRELAHLSRDDVIDDESDQMRTEIAKLRRDVEQLQNRMQVLEENSPKLSPPPQHVCEQCQARVQAVEEKLAVFFAALENEKRDRTRELAAQRNSFEAFHDECVAERERASNDRDMEVALLQNSQADLEARVRRLERH